MVTLAIWRVTKGKFEKVLLMNSLSSAFGSTWSLNLSWLAPSSFRSDTVLEREIHYPKKIHFRMFHQGLVKEL